jgi:hypothetical protein
LNKIYSLPSVAVALLIEALRHKSEGRGFRQVNREIFAHPVPQTNYAF